MNTVMGISEREFCRVWISKLWQAMAKTGKGYRRPSVKRDGKGERRADKVGTTKTSRSLALRAPVSA